MNHQRSLLSVVAGLAYLLSASVSLATEAAPVAIAVRADTPGGVIDPAIYGQFAEHLGHLIYEARCA